MYWLIIGRILFLMKERGAHKSRSLACTLIIVLETGKDIITSESPISIFMGGVMEFDVKLIPIRYSIRVHLIQTISWRTCYTAECVLDKGWKHVEKNWFCMYLHCSMNKNLISFWNCKTHLISIGLFSRSFPLIFQDFTLKLVGSSNKFKTFDHGYCCSSLLLNELKFQYMQGW